MSVLTAIQNFRTQRKVSQEKHNAGQTAQPKTKSPGLPFLAIPFALAFMFMLIAIAPAEAATINLTPITDLVNSFITLIEPITNLVIAIVPLWFVMQILGFIMGLLAAVLAMINFGKH